MNFKEQLKEDIKIFRELFSPLKLSILRSPVESLISVSKIETLVR